MGASVGEWMDGWMDWGGWRALVSAVMNLQVP